MSRWGIVIPTYGQFEYARACLESLDRTTDRYRAIVVDDATPDFDPGVVEQLRACVRRGEFEWHRYPINGGVTRSWNYGLASAVAAGCLYVAVANSDVLFSQGWDQAFEDCFRHGQAAYAGPLTNAPGDCPLQDVCRYLEDYQISDKPADIDAVAARLRYQSGTIRSRVNGFFQAAPLSTWASVCQECGFCFHPDPKYRMVGSEHEFQSRLRSLGGEVRVLTSAFIFHYRGVSRGLKRGAWAKLNLGAMRRS